MGYPVGVAASFSTNVSPRRLAPVPVGAVTALAFAFAVPVSTIPDLWTQDGRMRQGATAPEITTSVRRVTLLEARQVALDVFRRAEAARELAAAREADFFARLLEQVT